MADENLAAADVADNRFRLSNGMPIAKPSAAMISLVERMIAAGHAPATNSDGEVDFLFIDYGHHNGPGCSVCGDGVCEHCSPNWQPEPCPGVEAVEKKKRDQRYAQFLKLKAEFEVDPPVDLCAGDAA